MIKNATRTALAITAAAALTAGCTNMAGDTVSASAAPVGVMVGGATMLPTRNIVENASLSADHTTLVSAVQAAGLAGTLSSPGPFTVFAPTNAAFDKLPAGIVQSALRPENKAMLTGVLTYHTVAGRVTAADLVRMISEGGGSASITTLQGGTLTARRVGDNVTLTDGAGRTSNVTTADVFQSNGIVHVTDGVFLPG